MKLGSWRFNLALGLLLGAILLLGVRGTTEIIPSSPPLSFFPMQLGPWTGSDLPVDKETREVLGDGDFLVRGYEAAGGDLKYIELYIPYFHSQRSGDTIHSPKNCLPGAGWTPEKNDRVMLSMPGHAPFPVNRYVIAKGGARKLVLYWYWAHDRGVASEYWAKYYLVKDAIRMNRSDGALVRITTDMLPGESVDAAEKRLSPFTAQVLPLLDTYIPK
jgi:EpsI family protein